MYLYHRVPKNLQGCFLYPLNELKEKYPVVYAYEVQKYAGRKQLLNRRIPLLNCLWNDVLHFSAAHPKEIKQALADAGDSSGFTTTYFQIDPKSIDCKNTVIYLYSLPLREGKFDPDDFIAYDPEKLVKLSLMPQQTKEYYKEMINKDKKTLLYHKIPHILFRGSLDTSG